ncbi:MAG TPA: LysM peptidoglycan-binding domain-containing protein [Spirochaetales bacterium]|nr:LysM peptidoglycan-binding domain-containing protein [Spirochaetales bacterium]HPG85140.1 LysM peptidoglycan-binding domain-containing protein [Spirochaetales bacterium]HPM72957.1 LysM peptidoglycan-binding domain-containing protein [Spirochaetales bacterium]
MRRPAVAAVAATLATAALAGRAFGLDGQAGTPTPSPAAAAIAAIAAASEPEPPTSAAAAEQAIPRPLRSSGLGAPLYEHHAGPERYTLELPYGEPQFERFRASYLTAGGRLWLEAVYERSRPYASHVLERIRYYGLPEELFFLPFIESEYSAKAVSRSGASGLWQFMRNSVGGYDMRIDDWVDERRDFMKSTDGALRKLLSNYERFGDWPLAIAAYNCGAGAMDRAIKAGGGVRDYWVLRERGLLPSETASYIPKFLAVVSVAMHGGRNGLAQSWTPSIEWARVALDRPVDLAMLASASGTPLELLKAGNPELRYGVTPPEGRYAVKVPADYEPAVRKALASRDVLMNVYLHTVASGDTVSALAKHYEVSVAMIAKMNPGLDPGRIRIGQRLVIPAFKDKRPYVAAPKADDGAAFDGAYVVMKGDTLWAISLKYDVQPEILAARNGMSLDAVLREGTSLIVPILE